MHRYPIGSLTRHKPLGNSSIESDSKATIYDVFLIITIYYETELPEAAGCVIVVTESMSGSSEIKRLVITLSSLSLTTTSTLENKHLMKP